MDEMLHESEPESAGGEQPSGDSATAQPGMPQTVHFAPVEQPDQAVSPAQPVDDGLPGGEVPESSGFSWRLPGQPAAAQPVQGGIPNEFDHLFRDAPEDGRHSLLPGQGPIGVSRPVSGATGYRQTSAERPQNPAGNGQGNQGGQGNPSGQGGQPGPGNQGGPATQHGQGHQGGPGGQTGPGPTPGPPPTRALPPVGATGQQPPAYQPPTQDQIGYSQQGLPSRAYDSTGYQAQAQGYASDPDQHTQAIPRIPAQPYGPGPGGPDLLLATGPGRRQSKTTLLVAVGVFVVLIVVAAVAFSGGDGKPKGGNAKKSTTPDTASSSAPSTSVSALAGVDPEAKKQADAIWQIIAQSHELRSQANTAVSAVQQCKNMPENKQKFADVAAKRQGQADAVKGQAVDKLPGGPKLAADLISGWQLSAESENDYVAWTSDNLTCTGKPGANDNFARAQTAGQKAGSAKAEAVKDWNAFASKFGVQTITVTDL